MANHSNRRTFLKTTAATGAAGSMMAAPAPVAHESNIYTRMGVRPVINGVGVVTHLGGSLMPPEVVRAMEEASKYFVPLTELQRWLDEFNSKRSRADKIYSFLEENPEWEAFMYGRWNDPDYKKLKTAPVRI